MTDPFALFRFDAGDWQRPRDSWLGYGAQQCGSAFQQAYLASLQGLANAAPSPRVKKVREVIEAMGDKWCLHPANKVKRLPHTEVEFKGSRILTEWMRKRDELKRKG